MISKGNKIAGEIFSQELTEEDINKIIQALKAKGYVAQVILPYKPESTTVKDFLLKFWDYDCSPYIKEKKIVGKSIHRRYVKIMLYRVKKYIIPRFGDRLIGSMTKQDIKDFMIELIEARKSLKAETINQIVRSLTCPLKWAFHNDLIPNNCFDGINYCHVESEKRIILSKIEAKKVFSTKWNNETSKLANLISMCTGMRIGEVQALMIKDIAPDRIFVRHNWARLDGLKSPKNGNVREIKISPELYKSIYIQINNNPYKKPDSFIFFSDNPSRPANVRKWNDDLHFILNKLQIPNGNKITFHCWRHFYITNMADNINERKLQLSTGHKTLSMLEHYAAHTREETLSELETVQNKLFTPIIKAANYSTLHS